MTNKHATHIFFFTHSARPLEFPALLPASILSEALTPDQTLGQRDPTCPGEIKTLISFHACAPSSNTIVPPLLLHLSSHSHQPPRPMLGDLSLYSSPRSAPGAVISRRKHNVECQLPLSSLARPRILRIPHRPKTTGSAGEVNHLRHEHERVGIVGSDPAARSL